MELLEISHFIWAEGRGVEQKWVVVETRGLGKSKSYLVRVVSSRMIWLLSSGSGFIHTPDNRWLKPVKGFYCKSAWHRQGVWFMESTRNWWLCSPTKIPQLPSPQSMSLSALDSMTNNWQQRQTRLHSNSTIEYSGCASSSRGFASGSCVSRRQRWTDVCASSIVLCGKLSFSRPCLTRYR